MAIRVLIADDFALLREDLAETLSAEPDMEVVGQAASGAEIVRLAQETDFDVILMDIEMESTTAGIHATETILQHKPDALIIFLTAQRLLIYHLQKQSHAQRQRHHHLYILYH